MAKELFLEKVTAKVNEEPETGTHEVIFRGVNSANTLKLVNERGMKQVEDGKTYHIVVREIEPKRKATSPRKPAKPAKKEAVAATEEKQEQSEPQS